MGCRTCEKPKVSYKNGLWSPDQDQRLRDHIFQNGISCWSTVPAKAGLQRNGKSCRLRWINYLRPGLKRGNFPREEEEIVMNLQAKLGNKWSQIAMHLPGRTDNEVKNYWNSYLKKKVTKAQASDSHISATSSSDCTNQRLINPEEPNDRITSFAKHVEPLEMSAVLDLSQSDTRALSNFPKIIFGDWLSNLDHANNGESLFNSEETMSSPWQNTNSQKQVEQASDCRFNGYGGTCKYGEKQEQAGETSPENGLFDLLFPGVRRLRTATSTLVCVTFVIIYTYSIVV